MGSSVIVYVNTKAVETQSIASISWETANKPCNSHTPPLETKKQNHPSTTTIYRLSLVWSNPIQLSSSTKSSTLRFRGRIGHATAALELGITFDDDADTDLLITEVCIVDFSVAVLLASGVGLAGAGVPMTGLLLGFAGVAGEFLGFGLIADFGLTAGFGLSSAFALRCTSFALWIKSLGDRRVSSLSVRSKGRVGVAFEVVPEPMPASDATTTVAVVPSKRRINDWICMIFWVNVLRKRAAWA